MKQVTYPFSAIVGQDQMKMALLLAAIDWRLGVLLRGDKGAAKTTAARGLAVLLPEPAPFVNLPIGTTEDRLLGGLHLERTLKGDPVLKPGLLSEAHRGVLYIDEINLLPAHLGDALLDAASSGINIIEREGFSASHPAEFVLLGSMNPEEGSLRPQLLDRFALSADITAPLDPEERQEIVKRRICFEQDPAQFMNDWSGEQQTLREKITLARNRIMSIQCSSEILRRIVLIICEEGVRSLRADLAAVRASIAYAALMGQTSVKQDHVETVLPLVLNHRTRSGKRSSPPSPSPSPQPQPPAPSSQQTQEMAERVFAPKEITTPVVQTPVTSNAIRGTSKVVSDLHGTQVVGIRNTTSPQEIDLRATLNHAILETGNIHPRPSDLHEKIRRPAAGVRYLFVIDSSGSHAAHEKMRLVKGAVLDLLQRSFRRDDEVAIIAFRGTRAQVLLEPSRIMQDAATALEYLPTGGRTPLAHALELSKNYLTPSTLLILASDGRANVPLQSDDPFRDALEVAGQLHCRALVIDTENASQPLGKAQKLAHALKASSITLVDCERSGESMITINAPVEQIG